MTIEPDRAVLLAWPLVVALLFRVVGAHRAVLVAVIGGFLFLPPGQFKVEVAGFPFPIDKWNIIGLALIANCLLFGRAAVLRTRPSWWDLPMAAWYLAPLLGLLTADGSRTDIVDVMIGRGLGWVVPYAVGRIYFSQAEGPRQVAIALVIGGLAYVPICIYEQIAGPDAYLVTLLYGIPHSGNVDRLGGWRPNGFLGDGLVLASWMALTSITATWLWLGRVWCRGPWAALIALTLIVTTVSCRGVYGYMLLAIGLPLAVAFRLRRTPAWIAALAAVPLLYMGLRLSGAWSGTVLVDAAARLGRGSTVGFRMLAEQDMIDRVVGNHPVSGFGSYIWNATFSHWPDGGWLHVLWMGGVAGLIIWLLALMVLPVTSAFARARDTTAVTATQSYAAASLACWCVLQILDTLHNTSYITPLALISGTLIGYGRALRQASRPGLPE